MIDVLATAASALRHADRRLMAAAHDTANLSTADTVVLRSVARQAPLGQGVRPETQGRFEHRAELGSDRPDDGRAVAPALAAVGEQRASVQQARVQAQVTRTADDMLGTLVDVVG